VGTHPLGDTVSASLSREILHVKEAGDSSVLLEVRRLGPVPILNFFLAKLTIDGLLVAAVP